MSALLGVALAAAFVGGLAGGVHCAGMCGGIVRMLCSAPAAERAGMSWHYHLGYNTGRLASYCLAGALAGALGQAGLLTRAATWLQPLLFALASVMLVALGLYIAGLLPLVSRIEALGAGLWRVIQPWSRYVLPVTSFPRAFGLGVLWGWLPCGMVYAVLASAIALGNWWQGASLMLAFGLGTLPNLLGVGFLLQQVDRLRRARLPRLLAGGAVGLFGLYGVAKAIQPVVFAGDGFLCHVMPGLGSLLQ